MKGIAWGLLLGLSTWGGLVMLASIVGWLWVGLGIAVMAGWVLYLLATAPEGAEA